MCSQLNLDSNNIGGYYDPDQRKMISTPEGPKAIADALLVSASLTKISLAANNLGDEGAKSICDAMKVNKTVTELDLSGGLLSGSNIGGAAGAKHVADMILVSASLTKILVGWNQFGDEGTIILCDALRESKVSKVQELGLQNNGIGPDGAKAVAAFCAVSASLTKIS